MVGGGSFGYGWMDCRDDPCTRYHKGTDIMAVKLQPLVSPVDGVVERFLRHPTAGVGIVIRGDDGYQYRLYHLNNDSPGTDDGRAGPEWSFGDGLAPGVRVVAGELVGFVGDSGNAEDYLAHVHVEIHRPDGMPINPYWSLLDAERGEPAVRPGRRRRRRRGCGSSGCRCRRRGSVPTTTRLCARTIRARRVAAGGCRAGGAVGAVVVDVDRPAGRGRPVRPGRGARWSRSRSR